MTYSALVLDEKSHQKLLEVFSPLWENEQGWEPIAHHMTIKMGTLPEDQKHLLGQRFELRVVSFAQNERVMAVEVETSVPTTNNIPHVTLAVNRSRGGKPFQSNQLTTWTPVVREIYLKGVVEEV